MRGGSAGGQDGTDLHRTEAGSRWEGWLAQAHGLHSRDEGRWLWCNGPQLETGFPRPSSSVALAKRLQFPYQ